MRSIPRPSSWTIRVFVAVFLFTAGAFVARAQLPPTMPPEIQRIIQKMQAGQRPTPDEIKALTDWQRKVVSDAGGAAGQFTRPPGAPAAQGIPCQIDVDFSYTGNGPGAGASESGSLHGWTRAVLFPDIKGSGAWTPGNLNGNSTASTFRFEPEAPGGVPTRAGGGDGESVVRTIADTVTTKVRITNAFFGVLFVTTGRGDALYPNGTGFGGDVEGTATTHQNDGLIHEEPVKDNSLRFVSPLAIPFAAENLPQNQGLKPPPAGGTWPAPTFTLSLSQLVAALDSRQFATVTGTESFSFVMGGTRYEGSGTLTISLWPDNSCPLSDDQTTKAMQAFEKVAAVFTGEPRCANCHGGIDPFGPDAATTHAGGLFRPVMQAGKADSTDLADVDVDATFTLCQGCHSGLPGWRMAPRALFFIGKDSPTLCVQQKTRFHDPSEFLGHIANDNGGTPFTATAFAGTRALNDFAKDLMLKIPKPYRPEPPTIGRSELELRANAWVDALGGKFSGAPSCGCRPSH